MEFEEKEKTFENYRGAGVYADLLLDRTFKKAFDPDSPNKVCLIELLNAVLEGEIDSPITEVHSRDKELSNGSNDNRAKLRERDCSDLSGTLTFAFVELPKFKKTLEELETSLDRGLYALRNIKNLRRMPAFYAGTAFERLFSVAELAKLTKEEQKMIDEAQKAKWDAEAIRDYAIKSGRKEGLEQGFKEGVKKGVKKGVKEGVKKGVKKGILEGEKRKAREMAKSLREQGVSVEIIAKAAKLSADEIQQLE